METQLKKIEWELTSKCTFKCFYCFLPDIPTEINIFKIYKFIINNILPYKNNMEPLFLFGGEPFLHPRIEFILKTLNKLEIPYFIQTQLSNYTITKIQSLNPDIYIPIQISVHLTEQTMEDFLTKYHLIKNRCCIRKIDVMYSKEKTEIEYLKIKKEVGKDNFNNCHLVPIASFSNKDLRSDNLLKQYNKLRRTGLNKLINWETTPTLPELRSFIWEQQIDNSWSNIGKICKYKTFYKLYNSNLEGFTCHRQKNVDICEDRCFIM